MEPLENRLSAVEARLAQLEARLGVDATPAKLGESPAVGRIVSRTSDAQDIPFAATVIQGAQAPAAPAPVPAADASVTPPLPTIAPATDVSFPRRAAEMGAVLADLSHVAARDEAPVTPQVSQPSSPSPHFLPPALPRAQVHYQPKPGAVPSTSKGSLEQTIGLKVAGWVGAVVLVIGAALGIKFAYDNGWLGSLPASFKLILMSLVGFGFIGVGEVVYRRVNKTSAVGLFGAGVAMLFLVSYAGHGFYELYARDTAFVLMAISTLVGAAVAMRGKMVSIGVLSIIGGNIAPLVLRSDQPAIVPFLFYLLMLQAVALFLAWWGGTARWWTLRSVALVTSALWMTTMIFAGPSSLDLAAAPLRFTIVFAAIYQLELILSAIKRASRLRHEWSGATDAREAHRAIIAHRDAQASHVGGAINPPDAQRASGTHVADDAGGASSTYPASLLAQPEAPAGVMFSMIVTALLTVAVLCIFRHSSDAFRGAWAIGLSVASAILGFSLSSKHRAPREDQPGWIHPLHPLAIGYRAQAAVLLVVAVPVALSGAAVVYGWAALALGFALLGTSLNLAISRRASVATWMLSVGYLVLWTGRHLLLDDSANRAWMTILGHPLPAYWFVATSVALVGHAIGLIVPARLRADAPPSLHVELRGLARVAAIGSAIVLAVASIAALPPLGATTVLALYAWLLFAGDLAWPARGLVFQSAAVLVLATVKWVVVDMLADRLSPNWSASGYPALLNPMMGVGVFLSLTLAAIGWLRRDVLLKAQTSPDGSAGNRGPAALVLATFIVALMAIGLSFEVDRIVEASSASGGGWQVKQLAWTMLWSAAVAAIIGLIGWLIAPSPYRQRRLAVAGLAALAIAIKFLVIDTLAFRITDGLTSASLIPNVQRLAAGVVFGLLLLARSSNRRSDAPGELVSGIAGFASVFVLLWLGTFEIDRWAEHQALAAPWVARQVGWSIFWSTFAVGSVIGGFRARLAPLRYFGLGLFGLTLFKVVVVDLSSISTGYRILSFLGLGILLLGTSVLYGKVSPILLGEENGANSTRAAPST